MRDASIGVPISSASSASQSQNNPQLFDLLKKYRRTYTDWSENWIKDIPADQKHKDSYKDFNEQWQALDVKIRECSRAIDHNTFTEASLAADLNQLNQLCREVNDGLLSFLKTSYRTLHESKLDGLQKLDEQCKRLMHRQESSGISITGGNPENLRRNTGGQRPVTPPNQRSSLFFQGSNDGEDESDISTSQTTNLSSGISLNLGGNK